MSVAASFVWRCLNGSTMAPFPHPAHRTGQADFPHPALGQDFTPSLSRATPSAVSEHSPEFIGCPISRSFTTYCVCLELRSLPSTGVTRLQRYYEPLRHPKAPGLSLAGVRLVVADHALGLPVFRALSLCACCRQYPGAASGRSFAHSPSRISLPRYGSRVGLRIVLFEACSAFTRVAACTLALSPIRDTLIEGFSHFVTSVTAPIASGWSGCRVGLAPTRKRRLVTAHATTRHSDDARPRFWSSYDRSRLRHRGFMSSRKTSTRTPAPSVKTRSSKCRGPKRKSPVANGQSSVRLNIVATARRTSARAEFGPRTGSPSGRYDVEPDATLAVRNWALPLRASALGRSGLDTRGRRSCACFPRTHEAPMAQTATIVTGPKSRACVVRMSGCGVRRDKAALSSGCKPHPATAPAGSNRSSHGGNEVAE